CSAASPEANPPPANNASPSTHPTDSNVKRPLSHLFAQGAVSVDALRYEADARTALVKMVKRQPSGRVIDPAFQPRKVIYAIALGSGKPLTVNSLFTFAQVALYRAMKSLRNEGVEVEVVGIPSA
ncbi:DUF6119 family protein, partial [Micromonospora sp. NPDC005172]|uniref:DUF6119 family protein n=1 Tax=Micromonospora sp. NPDC005172 TaxID=3156867 RepID=UPI0033A15B55